MTYEYRNNRDFFYHMYDDDRFDDPLSSQPFSIVTKDDVAPYVSGGPKETKTFYSLKRDLEELRKIGKKKGIVDDTVVHLGRQSLKGRDLLAIKIGKSDEHRVLITGCHHAREWITVELAYLLAELLVLGYSEHPDPNDEMALRIKHLVNNRCVWVVPMVNPDGHMRTITEDRDWRPNLRKWVADKNETITAVRLGGGPSRQIQIPKGLVAEGVDINRNYFTTTWGQETYDGPFVQTSRDPRDSGDNSIWCGPDHESEPEAQAVGDLLRTRGFTAAMSYHSYGLQIIRQRNHVALVDWVGQGMVELVRAVHAVPYTYESPDKPYPTTGDQIELADEVKPARAVFTSEVRPALADGGHWGFSGLPEDQIGPCFQENGLAALALINAAPFQTPPTKTKITVPAAGSTVTIQVTRDAVDAVRTLRI